MKALSLEVGTFGSCTRRARHYCAAMVSTFEDYKSIELYKKWTREKFLSRIPYLKRCGKGVFIPFIGTCWIGRSHHYLSLVLLLVDVTGSCLSHRSIVLPKGMRLLTKRHVTLIQYPVDGFVFLYIK